MAEQWLSYAQIGEALGISTAAARHKVSRIRLARRLRNDGLAEVLVDVEDVRAKTPVRRPKRYRSEAAATPAETPLDAPALAVLQARLIELEVRLTDARSEAERERSDAERERGERLEERARADRLAGEVADLARKLGELAAVANTRFERRASSLPPVESVRRSWWPWRRAG